MAETIITQNATQGYIQEMARYAIVDNRRRMIPDVRDSFKPVQRKILYGMQELNAVSEGTKKKSARIVGDVMGKYHPHGDCISSDTKIYLLNGEVVSIEQLCKAGEPVRILAVNPETGKGVPAVAHSFRVGQYADKVYHVVFSNGYELKCTSNHPIMMADGSWVKAENLKPYTRVMSKPINFNNRPSIDNARIQDLVYEYYNGALPKGYIKHHIDHNIYNNTPENLLMLSRSEHAKLHGDYNTGLDLGRKSMFTEGSEMREDIKAKNSALMRLYNKEFGLRRFKSIINDLKEQGVEPTLENYEALRDTVYSLPKVDNLLKKYPQYNCNSFEDLVNLELPTVGELYEQSVCMVRSKEPHIEEETGVSPIIWIKDYMNSRNIVYSKINKIIDNNLPYDIQSYVNLNNGSYDYDIYFIEACMRTYPIEMPYIINVWVEEVDKEPMYDFTVDGLENMLIPMGTTVGTYAEPLIGNVMPMMCIHNSSIYGAMGNMTGWWRCKIPLINGWGNWGNFQGAKPAAMRYTEAYLSPFSNDCVLGLIKKYPSVVDWNPNFDGTAKEPAVLPTMIPLLLINGASGIGVGMKMDLPPHNVREVINVTRKLLRDPNAEVVLVPDLCMPCDIVDANWKKICNEGNGKFRVRGRIEVGEYKKAPALFIRSLPDGVTTDSIKTKLEEMTAKGVISQVKDILWEGSSTDMNLVIKLDKNADPYYFRDVVYKNTQAETSYSINFEAIHDLDHSRFSYKSYLEMYIINTKTTLFRMHCAKHHDATTRSFELDAYIKVMNSGKIDEIYKAIRKNKSSDNTELIAWLCKLLGVTEFQAGFIIKAPLSKFSKGNMLMYQAEYNECVAIAEENREYILNDDKIIEELDQILADYDKKYGSPRICNILKESDYSGVPKGTFKIVVTENNFIRKLQENDNVGIVKGDNPNFILKADNTENILLFSNKGKVYKLPVSKIPLTDKGAGTDIRLLIKGLTSDIANVMYEPDLVKISKMKWKHYLVTVSAGNSIKKLEIEDFLAVPPSGIFYTKLNETDTVQDVQIIPDGLDLVIYSGHKALRCPLQEIPLYKRNAVGVAAMNTKDNIGGLSVLYQDITHIAVVTKSGKINKFDAMGMPQAKRNQAGNSVIKLGTTDSIISIYGVNDNSTIRVITANSGSIDIAARDIPSTSSISAGKKIISTKGDYIIKTKLYQS